MKNKISESKHYIAASADSWAIDGMIVGGSKSCQITFANHVTKRLHDESGRMSDDSVLIQEAVAAISLPISTAKALAQALLQYAEGFESSGGEPQQYQDNESHG